MKYRGWVGTYTTKDSEGIYSFVFENSKFADVHLFAKIKNPKYLCFIGEYIAAVCDFEHGSGIALYDKQGICIDCLVYENSTSCYILAQGDYLYTCNYHNGTFSVIKLENKKLTLVKTALIKDKAGSHQVIIHDNKFLVPCLFLDKIIIFNSNYELEGSIDFDLNSGPRHAVFSDDRRYLYVIGELSNQLYVVDMLNNKVVNTVNVLPDGRVHLKDSAAIRASGDGKYLYISTRGEDVISVLKTAGAEVVLQDTIKSGGLHPRDFYLKDDFLIVANRNSNNIVSFSLKNGIIDAATDIAYLPEGVAIIMEGLK